MKYEGHRTTRSDSMGISPFHIGSVDPPYKDHVRVVDARAQPSQTARQGGSGQAGSFDYREVAKKLKQDYAHGARDATIRQLDTLHDLIKHLMKEDPDLDEMLAQTARLVYTQFNIKEVSIGLKSVSDGLYRYVVEHGMRADIWAAHKKIAYSYEDLYDAKKYRPVTISHQTKLYLAEDSPYAADEAGTYSEHMMKQSKRKSATDSIEGDYLDIFIFGPQDETLGWIEISGTWDGRIPDARAIRCLELVSAVLGIAIARHHAIVEMAKHDKPPEPPKKSDQAKK